MIIHNISQQETNVIGASSAIPNTNDLSLEDVNRIEIVEGISHPHSEKNNCDRSGDDVSTISASDQEQEILKTYSIASELVDAINEKEGNSVLVFPDNQTDEGRTVAENVTEQNTDHDMLSDLDIETLKDIPDKTDASQNHSGSGNISDYVESNESEPENNISDHNTESDHNIPQFSDCNFKAPEGSSNENGMDSDDNVADDDNIKDNEEQKCFTHSDNDDNTFQDVDMEPNDNDELEDNCKDTEQNRNGNKSDINDNQSEILQYDTEPEGKTTGKDSNSAKESQVDNDRTENNSNQGAVNSLELNLNAAITDDDDTESQKTIDFDEYEKQDVSSLQSSDLDIESDADEDTMQKLAAKLSKSSFEKEKPSKIKEKEKCQKLREKYRLVF